MFWLLFGGNIYSRVMKVMRQRIAEAEKKYHERCKMLDEHHEQIVKTLEQEREDAKDRHANELVSSIIGK